MSTPLAGQVALVTGATGGIGTATVARLAAEGAIVWVSDLVLTDCERLAAEVASSGADARPLALDVSDESAWIHAIAHIREQTGLSILVNNAGIADAAATVVSEELSSYEHVVGVTQIGVFLGMKHGGALIEATGGGSIINICSILGTVGGFGASFSYHAAKGAVRTMTKTAAVHWAERNVRVNSIHPGFIGTAKQLASWMGTPRGRRMVEGTPMNRLGAPEEVAAAISFLAGVDSSYITGAELYVDGGWTAV